MYSRGPYSQEVSKTYKVVSVLNKVPLLNIYRQGEITKISALDEDEWSSRQASYITPGE
jgi:hypothetical protein